MSNRERNGWSVVAGLFVVLLVLIGGGFLTFTVFFQPLVKTFGWDHAQTSLLVTILLVVMAIVSPLSGWLFERLPAQAVIGGGAVAVAAGFVIASRATSYAPMVVAFVVIGLGLGFSTLVPAQVVTASWFEDDRRATAIGVVMSGTALGGVVMILAAAQAVSAWGWRTAYLLLAAPVILIVLPVTLAKVRIRRRAPQEHGTGEATQSLPGLDIGEAIGTRSFWLMMLIYFANGFAVAITLAHIVPILLSQGFKFGPAAWVVEEYQVIGIAGSTLMGLLGDRIGGRAALSVCFMTTAISFLALAGATHLFWQIIFVISFGLSAAGPVSLMAILLIQTLGLKRFGFYSGLGNFLYTLGLAIGPLVAGHIFDVTGSYGDAITLGGLASLATAIVVLAVTVAPALRESPIVPSAAAK